MKALVRFLALILILIDLVGCSKEINDFWDYEYLVIDTTYSDLRRIDKVVHASLMTSTLNDYKIDLDRDSIYDLEFSARVLHTTTGMYWSSHIRTLNDGTEIDVLSIPELFANYSISFFNTSTNDSVTIGYYQNYSASKTYPLNLKIDTVIEYYPKIHSIGDTLNQLGNWKSGSFILEYNSTEEGWTMRTIQKGMWEAISNKYIGIRLLKGKNQYYGWVELSVRDYAISLNKCFLKMK